MGKDVIIRGETYNGVGKVNLLTANGSANFYDVSGALCTITAEYDEVEEYDEVYTSDKTAQEVYDALTVGINPVFRFHNLLDTDTYIYASMTKLESTADGEELTLSSFQTDAMIADTLSDYFTLTVHGEAPSVEKTVSGSLITITDALAEPAVALLTDIEPVQDLHGYNSPWPAGGGRNHLQNLKTTQTISGVTFTVYDDGSVNVNGTATATVVFSLNDNLPLTNGVSYIVNGSPLNTETTKWKFRVYNGTNDYIDTGNGKQFTFISNSSAKKCDIVVYQNTTISNVLIKPMIRLATDTNPTFAPYENICPISGFSAANIVVSPTQDAQDGTTYTVSFGTAGTVYGGTLDVTAGTLTVTHGQIASYAGETLPGAWISDRDVYAAGTTPTTGAQVVYELATPQTVQLTPTEVQMLLGTNNVWSDTGDTTLTYLADGRVNSLTALNMLLGGMYEPSSYVTDKEALSIIMGESE